MKTSECLQTILASTGAVGANLYHYPSHDSRYNSGDSKFVVASRLVKGAQEVSQRSPGELVGLASAVQTLTEGFRCYLVLQSSKEAGEVGFIRDAEKIYQAFSQGLFTVVSSPDNRLSSISSKPAGYRRWYETMREINSLHQKYESTDTQDVLKQMGRMQGLLTLIGSEGQSFESQVVTVQG